MNAHEQPKVRGLGLCSGGLDSMLAALVLRQQEIEVEWITFETPFFSSAKARKAAKLTGIPLTVRDITTVYLEMLKDPHCGYGQHMNPCLDCHALMFRLAGTTMGQRGFNFLFSGEVLGQRPMSQTRSSLRYVEKHSGLEGYILRPLSARRLPETIPEKKGWVDRSRLLNIAGRGRKDQIRLAATFGLKEYPAPAGGCLLTDKGFTRRLKDLFDHQQHHSEAELHLLRYGRHLRLNPQTKIIVGRSQEDNANILQYHDPQADVVLKVQEHPGPISLVPGGCDPPALSLAATICASYSQAPKVIAPVTVNAQSPDGKAMLRVIALPSKDFKHLLI